MSLFALNLVLAVIWMFLSGDISLASLLLGLSVGLGVISVHQQLLASRSYGRTLLALCKLLLTFAWRLWQASWQLARDILRRKLIFKPAIIAFQATGMSATQMAVLANLISLTPGSITIDIDEENSIIYVHSLYGGDSNKVYGEITVYAQLVCQASGSSQAFDKGTS